MPHFEWNSIITICHLIWWDWWTKFRKSRGHFQEPGPHRQEPPWRGRGSSRGEAGPGGHPGVTRLGGEGGLGGGACLSSHIAEVLLNGGHRSSWVPSKGGAGQGLGWSLVSNLYQGDKLGLRSPHILLAWSFSVENHFCIVKWEGSCNCKSSNLCRQ